MKATAKELTSTLAPLSWKFSVFAAIPQAWLVSFSFGDVERVGRP
jgi:hypothetical protein